MEIDDERIGQAVKRTEILRLPKQTLSTFGTTNIHYYLLTEPAYSGLFNDTGETVIREGRVIAERPRIVTPYYLTQLDGFSDSARRYFELLRASRGGQAPGILYSYKNEPRELSIVSDRLAAVVNRLNAEIDGHGDPLVSIIKGEDELWDVSLLKFISEMTRNSLPSNLEQLGGRGLLDMDSQGVPLDARVRIDDLFRQVFRRERDPGELKKELDRWGLFEEYQDRFLALFRRK
ncbi:MAG: hypothetical protein V1780_01630 [Chloroflexota bacterium]